MNSSKPIFPTLEIAGETDPVAETALLSSLIAGVCGVGQVSRILSPASFSVADHGAVYEALLELEAGKYRINAFEVSQLLKTKHGDPRKWAGLISNLRASFPATNAEATAFRLVELSASRMLKQSLSDALVQLGSFRGDVFEIAAAVRQTVSDFEAGISAMKERPHAEQVTDWLRHKEEVRAGNVPPGIPTGIGGFDRVMKGLIGGKLYVIAARPGMGKSALLCAMTYNISHRGRVPVKVFSLEMTNDELTDRLVAIDSGYSNSELAEVRSTTPEHLAASAGRIGSMPVVLTDNVYSIDEVEMRTRQAVREKGVGVVFIDYLQLLKNGKGGNREQEIADYSRRLKQLAKSVNVPVVALSQLSRSVEARSDKRPLLSDLRESGAIEQDADVVMMLYRDEYYNPPTPETEQNLEAHFRKNRGGFTTKADEPVQCQYDAPTNRIWDWGRASPFRPLEGSPSIYARQFPPTKPDF